MAKNVSLAISLFLFAFVLYLGDRFGIFTSVKFFLAGLIAPSQRQLHTFQIIPFFESNQIKLLQTENQDLKTKMANYATLQEENKALREEVGSPPPQPTNLILAHVVSSNYAFIIDRGANDGIKQNMNVVYKNFYIGRVTTVGRTTSKISLPTDKESSIEVTIAATGVKGLLVGSGTDMTLSQVLLSEKLAPNDLLETIGSSDANGVVIYPHLIIGQIDTIRKSANQLFQEAKITPPIDFSQLDTVFVME